MKRIFISGISTEVGKTVAAAILTEALQADYWKPVQSGSITDSDTRTVKSLISNSKTKFHPEAYSLREPLSPHAAAELDGVKIDLTKIIPPDTNNHLIIEGAGGLLVPLNNQSLVIDLIQQLEAEVVLVSRNYLGSINHTLLSVEALRNRNIPVRGLIFNGDLTPQSEEYILNYTGLAKLLHIHPEAELSPEIIQKYAAQINLDLF